MISVESQQFDRIQPAEITHFFLKRTLRRWAAGPRVLLGGQNDSMPPSQTWPERCSTFMADLAWQCATIDDKDLAGYECSLVGDPRHHSRDFINPACPTQRMNGTEPPARLLRKSGDQVDVEIRVDPARSHAVTTHPVWPAIHRGSTRQVMQPCF